MKHHLKKVIALQIATILAFASIGIANVHASEVTGNLSSSAASSGSTTGGTVGGGTSGGSTVTGTVSGGSGGGSSVTGTVTGGGGGGTGGASIIGVVGGGGGGGGGSSIAGTVGGGGGGQGTITQPQGQVLGASTVALTPGLPTAGFGPNDAANANTNSGMAALLVLASLLVAGYIKIKSAE